MSDQISNNNTPCGPPAGPAGPLRNLATELAAAAKSEWSAPPAPTIRGAPLKKRRLENATVKKEFEDFMKNETDATCDMVKMLCESAASATRLRFQGYENQLAVEVSSNQSESSVAEVARLETCANIDSLKLIRDLIDETRRNRLEFYLKYVNGRITPTPPTPSEIEDE